MFKSINNSIFLYLAVFIGYFVIMSLLVAAGSTISTKPDLLS